MRILAIETIGRHGSLALLESTDSAAQMLRQVRFAGEDRTAQILQPSLLRLLSEVGWPASSLQLIAVAIGPGSFTGLRIGVTAAKALAYATGAEIVGVDSLAVLANQAPAAHSPLWAVLDAQRSELFAAKFDATGERNPDEGESRVVSAEKWISQLRSGDRVLGPPLARFVPRLPDSIEVVPEEFWPPTATSVGQLAWKAYLEGRRDDGWKLVPFYLRPSAAEEKKDRLEQKMSE